MLSGEVTPAAPGSAKLEGWAWSGCPPLGAPLPAPLQRAGPHPSLQVTKFEDPQEACLSVVAESYRLWLQHETRTDDITMIVIQFQGLEDEAPQMALPTPSG